MPANLQHLTGQVPGSAGDQTWTFTDLTTVAGIFVFCCGDSNWGYLGRDHSSISVGFADGTNQGCCSCHCRDAVTSNNAWKRAMTDEVIHFITNSGGIDAEANVSSISGNVVTLNWSGAPSLASSARISMLAFGGKLTQCHVGTFDTTSGNATVTGVGFEARYLMGASTHEAIDDAIKTSNAEMSLGFCTNIDGTVDQASYNWGNDNKSFIEGSKVYAYTEDTNFIRDIDDSGGVNGAQLLTAFGSDGFTANQVNSAGYASLFMAVRFNDPGGDPDDTIYIDKGTVPNNIDLDSPQEEITGHGHRPGAHIVVPTRCAAFNTIEQDSDAGGFFCGITSGDSSTRIRAVHGITEEDGVNTTESKSFVHNEPDIMFMDDDGGVTDVIVATLQNYTNDGLIWKWQYVPTNSSKMILVTFKEPEQWTVLDAGVTFSYFWSTETAKIKFFEYDMGIIEGRYNDNRLKLITDEIQATESGGTVTVIHGPSGTTIGSGGLSAFDIGPFILYVNSTNDSFVLVYDAEDLRIGRLDI